MQMGWCCKEDKHWRWGYEIEKQHSSSQSRGSNDILLHFFAFVFYFKVQTLKLIFYVSSLTSLCSYFRLLLDSMKLLPNHSWKVLWVLTRIIQFKLRILM